MAERDLVVRFIGDDRDLQRAFKKSEKGAQTLNARLTNASAGIARWGRTAAIGAAAATAGLVVIGTRGVRAASDLNEEINKSSVLFGESADAILSWSKTTSASIGLSQRAALQGAGNFGAMFATIGVGEKTSVAMSKRLVQLSADLGSFSNQSPEEMLDRLRSGLAGEAEPLRRFGILLSEARVKQEAVRLGLVKTGDELTEQQKVQARYSLILQDSAKAQGDFARTSDSFANAQRIARAQIEDLSASLGKALLPTVARTLTAFNRLLPVLTSGIGQALDRITPTVSRLADAFAGRIPEIRRLIVSMVEPVRQNVLPILRDLWGIWQRTWAGILDVLSQNRDNIRKILANIGETLRMVWVLAKPTIVFLFTKALPAAIRIAIPILERVTSVVRVLATVFTKSVAFIIRAIEKFIAGLGFLADAASKLPFVGDKFKGIRDKIETSRASLRTFAGDLDALNGKQVEVGITVRTTVIGDRGKGARGPGRGPSVSGSIKEATDQVVKDATAGLEATNEVTEVTNATTTATEKATTAADRQTRAANRLRTRLEKAQRAQYLALGLTATGERRGPSVRNLRDRVGSLRRQIKGTVLDTAKTRGELARIAKVLSGAYGKVGREVRDAILQMLNDISSALKDGSKSVGKSVSQSTGELTRGGIRSTEKLIKGLGLTKAQANAIRRRNRGIRRRGGLSAFGFAIDGADRDGAGPRIPTARLGGRGGDRAIIINGPITVVTDDPDDFMRKLQKKSSRTSGSRRGRHGGVRLGLG